MEVHRCAGSPGGELTGARQVLGIQPTADWERTR